MRRHFFVPLIIMHFYYLIAIIYIILALYYYKKDGPTVPLALYLAAGIIYTYAARMEAKKENNAA